MKRKLLFSAFVSLFCACATTSGKFDKIYPGMTAADVNKTMGKGPNSVKPFGDEYSAWYYGEDRCLLLKNGSVLTKEQSKKGSSLEVFGLGGFDSKTVAECVPPGYETEKKVKHKLDTPFGSVGN